MRIQFQGIDFSCSIGALCQGLFGVSGFPHPLKNVGPDVPILRNGQTSFGPEVRLSPGDSIPLRIGSPASQ